MATLNIRIDDKLKEQAYQVLEELGVSPSESIRQMLQYIATNKRLPIKVSISGYDNYESTKDIWNEYLKTRNVLQTLVKKLKQDNILNENDVKDLFLIIDELIRCLNLNAVKLIEFKEWSDICSRLQKLGYILKFQGLTTNESTDRKYQDDSVEELKSTFYLIEQDALELMINTRDL
ncbi:MAG: type II toxin-antitoxin system RelB/DinJ family antitoxin [Psychrosphaera sp.]|nr:type II toxin-antitoxin system RelB/DinJ family antitoxin [Psychrosphaera sp.]